MNPSKREHPATTPYANLTTYRRDGRAVTTPVWIVADNGHFYVGTTTDTGKYKRIRAAAPGAARVRLVPCNHDGRQEYGTPWEGTAHEVADPAVRARVQGLMVRKYGRVVFGLIMLLYRLRGRYHKRTVLELDVHPAA